MKLRGESMQAAADAKASGMVSVIGIDSDTVRGPVRHHHLYLHKFEIS